MTLLRVRHLAAPPVDPPGMTARHRNMGRFREISHICQTVASDRSAWGYRPARAGVVTRMAMAPVAGRVIRPRLARLSRVVSMASV